eukprot:CAMPEP_0118713058 /NCGR_PEP_ID=MMETSP0800-20121206/25250_1 /TAXON_ID=210618 ORGANISM="Striatella unipunctata, Strain CCMP2910" /NCGR_SAMPLE_ID=MMETSP0800 /ASSEMBLY_ACC=CAM_ASM_000638 /LENGTH=379 /DNA_ID=CAMNT_0006618357 /DNA_START=504 /DNA_END=1643 /DNA_ORIENTATION=-
MAYVANYTNNSVKTLALGDPVLRGGFRNQFMRLMGLVMYAATEGFTQILLPSLKWYDTIDRPVPMEMLFDVEHWNNHRGGILPKLVPYDPIQFPDWDPTVDFFYKSCIYFPRWWYAPGRSSLFSNLRNYTRPYAIGGGAAMGNLWERYHYFVRKGKLNETVTVSELEGTLTRALKPSKEVQRAVDQCVSQFGKPYMAVHARVEDEMLIHPICSDRKQRNLTQIFEHIGRDLPRLRPTAPIPQTLFVAIDRNRMGRWPYRSASKGSKKYKQLHEDNVRVLNAVAEVGLPWFSSNGQVRSIDMKECGTDGVRSISPCMHNISASVVNFDVAVNADVFVGTSISSYSISVWKTRVLKGIQNNYEYTLEGIRELEGLPEAHKC